MERMEGEEEDEEGGEGLMEKVGEGERGGRWMWEWKEVGRGGRGVRPKGRDIVCGGVVWCGVVVMWCIWS